MCVMVLTNSKMLPIGALVPDFSLPNVVDGKLVSRDDFKGKAGLLVMFICNHCPYVKHIQNHLGPIVHEYMDKGMGVVAINSNSTITHPQDGPDEMKKLVLEKKWKFPFLFDETQEVAKAFKAVCTPEFFLFDHDFKLYYHGQFDRSRPGNDVPVTGEDLRAAMDALLRKEPPPKDQKPSSGCSIKWHPGNEPEYLMD